MMNACPGILNTGMYGAVVLPYAVGIFSLIILKRWKRLQWAFFFLSTLFQLFAAYSLFRSGNFGSGISQKFPLALSPIPGLGQSAFFQFTGLGFIFFAGSTIVTLIISIFSLAFNDRDHATGVAPLWTILMGANAGIFFAGDWFSFLISWEVMGWTSFLIIAHGREDSRKAALYYYILSLIGSSAMLAGIFIGISGSGSMAIADSVRYFSGLWGTRNSLVVLSTLFFTIAFFAKSAVFPFYMWPSLAHAEAPDDFSSFLSGVMIKYGVFGLIAVVLPIYRAGYVGPAVRGVPLYLAVLGWFGVITAVLGTLYAIKQDDMKKLMAYSTVSNIGLIIAALSMNSSLGIAAALFHTFNHMVFKGGIFLSLASVKYRTGEREMHKLGGMAYRMPLSFFTFLICIIAAAGIPPMSGFASKWMIYQALFEKKMLIMAIPAFFASTGSFLYLYRGLHTIYLGQLSNRFAKIKEVPAPMAFAMLIMMFIVMLGGFFPGLVLSPVNSIFTGMGLAPISQDLFSIQGVTTSIRLTSIGAIFMGSFFIVGFLYLIGRKREHVEQLDTYTSGETPEEWGLTEEKYHYGMHFYEPFEVTIEPFLKGTSMDGLFRRIGFEAGKLSGTVKRWFNTPQLGTLVLLIVVVLLVVVFGGIV